MIRFMGQSHTYRKFGCGVGFIKAAFNISIPPLPSDIHASRFNVKTAWTGPGCCVFYDGDFAVDRVCSCGRVCCGSAFASGSCFGCNFGCYHHRACEVWVQPVVRPRFRSSACRHLWNAIPFCCPEWTRYIATVFHNIWEAGVSIWP